MSKSKEACLWSYKGGCVVEENVISLAGRIKDLLNLPPETDNIKLIKIIRSKHEEASLKDKDKDEVTRLVIDYMKFSISGCDNCAFKKAAQIFIKDRR